MTDQEDELPSELEPILRQIESLLNQHGSDIALMVAGCIFVAALAALSDFNIIRANAAIDRLSDWLKRIVEKKFAAKPRIH